MKDLRSLMNDAGLRAGDFSSFVPSARELYRGHWSPTSRTLMALVGGGLFGYGLTREAPLACVLGSIGLALAAEAAFNCSVEEMAHPVDTVREIASHTDLGFTHAKQRTEELMHTAGATVGG